MVKTKNAKKKTEKNKTKVTKVVKKEEEEMDSDEGSSLDDAFGDDKDGTSNDEMSDELDGIEKEIKGNEKHSNEITIKASKPITKIRKGDKIKIDGEGYEVDQHYVLMNHKNTKEMAIELFDKNDKDFQLRYFDDQVESTLDFYELREIMYFKKPMHKIEW